MDTVKQIQDTLTSFNDILNSFGLWQYFFMFLITMAMVYLFGKMLNIAKSDTAKNSIAFVTCILCSVANVYFKLNDFSKFTLLNYRDIFIQTCVGILLYVLLGFKLFNRIEGLLDKIAPDREKKER